MKKFLYLFLGLLAFSCNSDKNSDPYEGSETIRSSDAVLSACGVEAPQQNLPWLAEIIAMAEKDKVGEATDRLPGNYLCVIWLAKWQNQDLFVIEYSVRNILAEIRDCSGNYINNGRPDGLMPEEEYVPFISYARQEGTVVYTTYPMELIRPNND
jgi:hypothetical protein